MCIRDRNKIIQITVTKKFDFDREDPDLEQRLEYYIDDPGMNAHHLHWHEAYLDAVGFHYVEDRDRAGELFYYMHAQMIARLVEKLFSHILFAYSFFVLRSNQACHQSSFLKIVEQRPKKNH